MAAVARPPVPWFREHSHLVQWWFPKHGSIRSIRWRKRLSHRQRQREGGGVWYGLSRLEGRIAPHVARAAAAIHREDDARPRNAQKALDRRQARARAAEPPPDLMLWRCRLAARGEPLQLRLDLLQRRRPWPVHFDAAVSAPPDYSLTGSGYKIQGGGEIDRQTDRGTGIHTSTRYSLTGNQIRDTVRYSS
jgi:hypothetical protein